MILGARYPLSLVEEPHKGRSIVSLGTIPKASTIEIAPVQVLPPDLAKKIEAFKLDVFVYWKCKGFAATLAIPLGLFGLCNHSDRPNAKLLIDTRNRLIKLVSLRRIHSGEELTIKYRKPSRVY
jgi:SET domain